MVWAPNVSVVLRGRIYPPSPYEGDVSTPSGAWSLPVSAVGFLQGPDWGSSSPASLPACSAGFELRKSVSAHKQRSGCILRLV